MVCVIYTKPVGDLGASRHTPSSKPVRRSTAVRVRGAWAWGAGYGRRAVSAAPGMAKPDPGPGASARFFSCPPRTIKPPPVAWAAQAPQHPEVRELASPPCVGSVRRPRSRGLAWSHLLAPGTSLPAANGAGWTGFVVVMTGIPWRRSSVKRRRVGQPSVAGWIHPSGCSRCLVHPACAQSPGHVLPPLPDRPTQSARPFVSRLVRRPAFKGPRRSTGVSIWWTPHGCFSQKRRRRHGAPAAQPQNLNRARERKYTPVRSSG